MTAATSQAKPAAPRSGKWPATRAEHLRREPTCAACGTSQDLEVHHVQPFHLFPALELDQSNLITLCEQSGRNCHYFFGHGYNWHCWNPTVREDAAAFLKKMRTLPCGKQQTYQGGGSAG